MWIIKRVSDGAYWCGTDQNGDWVFTYQLSDARTFDHNEPEYLTKSEVWEEVSHEDS
jgi:hypothetical protein